jgi:hypothetical protein
MDGGDRKGRTMSLSEISNILWRERRLLELLMFKLEEEQLVLASGRTRWLSQATHEVATILEEIKRVELERAMAIADSGELGMPHAPSLRDLTAIAPTPWDGIFAEHRRALLLLADEIDAITESTREPLRRGQQAEREALAARDEIDLDTFDAGGGMADRSRTLRLVYEAL